MKKICLLLILVTSLLTISAQRTITGKVNDENGSPVANASVLIKETNKGTSTKNDGSFSIVADPGAKTIIISFIDKITAEVLIGNQSEINVQLKPDNKSLSEVVVIAYGTSKKESFTGSANKIDGNKITSRPLTDIVSALAGAAPGVQANAGSGQPGVTPAIRIRGIGSINAANDPLYVVDGVPYSASTANISPDDVESITLLKDASSTALYGARAANGVVMITTKKGRKGRNQVNVRAAKSFTSRGIQEYERVDAKQYYPLMWEALRNSLAYRASSPVPIAQASQIASGLVSGQNGVKDVLSYNPFNVAANDIVKVDGTLNPNAQLIYSQDDLDWEGRIKREGIRDDYNINFGGGLDKTDYFVSLGYLKDEGYTIKTDYERISGRINLNSQVLSWLKTGLNLTGTFIKSNVAADPTASGTSSTAFVNPFFFSRNIGPIYPVYAQNTTSGAYILDAATGGKQYDYGNLTTLGLPVRPGGGFGGRHAIAETELNENFFKRNVWGARTYAEVNFLKNFKFTTNISVDITNRLDVSYGNKKVGDAAPAGSLSKQNRTITSNNFNQLLNYNKVISKHSVEVLAGHENYSYKDDVTNASRSNQIIDNIFELVNFTTTTGVNSFQDNYRVEGFFSRVNYNFQNKYFISGSFRRDGSSRFSLENRWGNFWSISGAWKLDAEKFFNNMDWLSQLKIRSSYGEIGNDAGIGFYASQPLFALGWNNGSEPGIIRGTYADPNTAIVGNFGSLGNNNLSWEASKNFDVGIEFGLLKNRVIGTIEFFKRESDNLLFDVPLPLSSGVLSQTKNIGSMYNKGWEFNINADIIKTKDFNWNINTNLTTFKNRITKLPQKEIITGTKKLMVGHSIFDYWLRDWEGVDPADGAALYRADVYNTANSRIRGKNDTVTISQNNARFSYHGSAIPDFYGSVSTSFAFKFIELSAILTYQVGGKVYDAPWASLMSSGNYGGAASIDLLRRWQKPGDITNVPRMDAGQTAAFGAQSSRWLTDASNINIRNITVSYVFPQTVLSRIKMQNARFYISGENLALFSKRKGMNVEQTFTGVTSNVYNPARVITAGINLTL